jgi:haloacetate dehalogenase
LPQKRQKIVKVLAAAVPFYAKDGGPLGIWRQWAPHARGQAMKGGHFFPEENPDDTAVFVKQFLSA